MQSLIELIDKGSVICGSDSALAERLGWPRSRISDLRAGRAIWSPEIVALLADVCELPGEETMRLVAQAIIENPKNAFKREALKRAFFAS